MNSCIKCQSECDSNYCPNCGHPQQLERINGRYIVAEMASVLNFEKGFLYTTRELLLRPGQSIRKFIAEDRNRLVKPILFIFISSLIYSIAVRVFNLNDGYLNYNFDEWPDSATAFLFRWISDHYGYANLIMAVFIALWIKVLFRQYSDNIYEILILLCFVMGVGMLMFTVFGLLERLTRLALLAYGGYVFFIYALWAIGQFFEPRKRINYFKALVSYLLGMLSFTFVALGVGLLIDWIR